MGHPRNGTVKHVIINQPSFDEFYWLTWEQFSDYPTPEWRPQVKKFETYEQARAFSHAL